VSLFTDIMGQPGGELLFDTNREAVVYVARGGAETNLTALVGDAKIIERKAADGIRKVRTRDITIWATVHAVYGGVVAPSLTASVSIGGELWSVFGIAASSTNFWRLTLEATSQSHKTREQAFGTP